MADNSKAKLFQKLTAVQSVASVSKSRYNDYGNFYYRSIGDLFAAIKPALLANNAAVYIEDEIVIIGNDTSCNSNGEVISSGERTYIKATVHFVDCDTGEELTTSAYARECNHHNMSADQSSGSASSYARKYALNAMFLFDDGVEEGNQAVQKPQNNQPTKQSKKSIPWGGKGNSTPAPPPVPDDIPLPEPPPQYSRKNRSA